MKGFGATSRKTINALRGITAIGLSTSALVARRTLATSIADLQALTKGASRRTPIGDLEEVEVQATGLHARFTNAELDISLVAEDVLRIEWTPGEPPFPIAVEQPPAWPAPTTSVSHAEDRWTISGSALEATVYADGSIRVARRDGSGEPVAVWEARPPQRRGRGWVHRARLHPRERIHGLGLQAAPLNLAGHSFTLFNRDPGGSYGTGQDPLYMAIPVYWGIHENGAYLAFHENSHRGRVTIGPRLEAEFSGGALRTWLMVGEPASLIERYTELTGRPPLPPRWALGYHQSRWGYGSQQEIATLADRFEQLDIPLSAIHLDLDYMDRFRVFTIDPAAFPDMAGLATSLVSRDIRLVTIVDCGVKVDADFDIYRDGLEGGHFCTLPDGSVSHGVVWPGLCAFPDYTDDAASRWWGGLYQRLTNEGIEGIWHDMNEPTSLALWGDRSLSPETRHSLGGRGGDHREAHNLYGLFQDRAAFEALRELRADRRPFLLSRSGWAGVQRYAWHWTADVDTSWEAFSQQIPSLVGLGLSGVPYSGSDIGGFSASPSPELYLRWLQAAVFTPFCRTHSSLSTAHREPWCFDEPIVSHIREAIRTRYRILPYLYTLAREASESGHPLMRPLWWADHRDPALWEVDDCFLLGNDLLVAPVLSPGRDSRVVRLPAGHWYSLMDELAAPEPLFGEGVITGGRQAALATPLESIPVLVRAGAIVPLAASGGVARSGGTGALGWVAGSGGPGTRGGVARSGGPATELHLFVDTSGAAHGSLYDDAGDGYGPHRYDHFTYRDSMLSRTSVGDYPVPDAYRLVLHGKPLATATADGAPLAIEGQGVVVPGGFNEATLGA